MLFDSNLRRELVRGFGATLVVVLTIMLTSLVIKTFGQAADGAIAPQDVLLLMSYVALGYLPIMMAGSLFVAIVLTLGRMYRDSEMVIWFSGGAGLFRFVAPVLRMGAPIVLVITLLLLVVWPWGNRNNQDLRDRYQQRSDLSRVAPGVFQTSADGQRVFFVERASKGSVDARNVFILSQHDATESVTTAQSGRLENEGDARFLILRNGQRNDVDRATGERTLSSFQSYRVLASERAVRAAEALPPKATGTLDLIRQPTPRNAGELTWRLGLALGAANLILLGIGLAATDPRRASNWNLLFAILAFGVYYNLINLSQAWVASGRVAMGLALLLLHGSALAFALALLWWREHGAVTNLWRRRPAAVAAA
ncbi:MAG: LPS export ABC transporter permease LptF [Burkholderiales bacterium]|nr:LPS export ABC transporter permease LptF [Burkholderiales bacterium]MDE2160337.1 LPS export ABC transporter permease LptF [Burkholderiales bacterium]MDE2502670.1 LPS export ABC transporter permease LptF [Burkholderiales bacterium]